MRLAVDLVIIFIFGLLVSCSKIGVLRLPQSQEKVAQDDQNDEDESGAKNTLYEVLPGDTLSSISVRYGTNPQYLIELNKMKKPYIIKPGKLIIVPLLNDDNIVKKKKVTVKITPPQK